MKRKILCRPYAALIAAAIIAMPLLAHAHGDEGHGMHATRASMSTEEKPFGRAGDPARVTRTIRLDMSDKMRFNPSEITVRQGETIHFIVTNSGTVLHEMVIGTMDELKEHHALMKQFPNMEHDEPHMAHVPPSKKENMVWQFTKPGEFYFACLIPGHFEAGMVGKINVVKG